MTLSARSRELLDWLAHRPEPVRAPEYGSPTEWIAVGSGDALAVADLGTLWGARSASSGDLAWSRMPLPNSLAIGISASGKTSATVLALRHAASLAVPTLAITGAIESPLAGGADRAVVPPIGRDSAVPPALAYVALAEAYWVLLGGEPLSAERTQTWLSSIDGASTVQPFVSSEMPRGITLAAGWPLRPSAAFWALKLIEATGVPVRVAALEDLGHVDYFLGPERSLVVIFATEHERPRATQLAEACARNGHETVFVPGLDRIRELPGLDPLVALAVRGADVAAELANAWGRTPFRAGEVDLSGRHIAWAGDQNI